MRFIGALLLICLSGCQRERSGVRPTPATVAVFGNAAWEGTLRPGGGKPPEQVSNPDYGNAYNISEGQRLFNWYNCSGCHANGGGGIGPPLIKSEWIYGGDPANIFDTIVKGRPNGMPSWGGKIPEYQVWQIVAYVGSMNQQQPQAATPVRADSLEIKSTTILPAKGPTQ